MGARLLYLHGFRSSPASSKAQSLIARATAHGVADAVWCGALSPVPFEAIKQIEAQIALATGPVSLVGSSLGGFYATHLAEKHGLRAVLVNPAVFLPGFDASPFVGEHANLYTGELFSFTWDHAAQIEALRPATLTDPARYWLLAEEADEVLDTRIAVGHYAGAQQTVLPGGDHSFTRWDDYLDAILRHAGLIA